MIAAETTLPVVDEESEVLSLEALLIARTYIYEMAHKLTGGTPTPELIDLLFGPTMGDSIDEYSDDYEPLRSFGSYLKQLSAKMGSGFLEEVKDEYTRCFIGPASLPAIPIASPYITNDSSAIQERTLVVRALYREFGYEPKRLLRVPDDHLSTICHLMAKLSEESLHDFKTGESIRFASSLRRQKGVVVNQLDSWISLYAKDMRRSQSSVIYPQFIEAFVAFVKADIGFLDEAAFWAENNEDLIAYAVDADTINAESFKKPIDDLDALKKVELFGLEENELVPYESEEKGI